MTTSTHASQKLSLWHVLKARATSSWNLAWNFLQRAFDVLLFETCPHTNLIFQLIKAQTPAETSWTKQKVSAEALSYAVYSCLLDHDYFSLHFYYPFSILTAGRIVAIVGSRRISKDLSIPLLFWSKLAFDLTRLYTDFHTCSSIILIYWNGAVCYIGL